MAENTFVRLVDADNQIVWIAFNSILAVCEDRVDSTRSSIILPNAKVTMAGTPDAVMTELAELLSDSSEDTE